MTNGFNEIYFTASATTFKIKRVIQASNCLLSNVSVKEVGQHWGFDTGWSTNGSGALWTAGDRDRDWETNNY